MAPGWHPRGAQRRSPEEAGRRLGVPASTVRGRLQLARATLRRHLPEGAARPAGARRPLAEALSALRQTTLADVRAPVHRAALLFLGVPTHTIPPGVAAAGSGATADAPPARPSPHAAGASPPIATGSAADGGPGCAPLAQTMPGAGAGPAADPLARGATAPDAPSGRTGSPGHAARSSPAAVRATGHGGGPGWG